MGTILARRICYLHPVGLEKSVSVDLDEVTARLNEDAGGKGLTLWVVPGYIVRFIPTNDERRRTNVGRWSLVVGRSLFIKSKIMERSQQEFILDTTPVIHIPSLQEQKRRPIYGRLRQPSVARPSQAIDSVDCRNRRPA